MSKYLSRKIKFISLFAMIAVVYIHSYNFTDSFLTPATRISEGANPTAMIEYFFSNGLFRFAVPLFFIISGFLFYYTYKNTIDGYKKKLLKRCYSIVTPYIIWSFLSGIFILALSNFDLTKNLDIVVEHPVTKTVDFLKCFINPPAFQLWFLQQLIIFIVLSPIIYLLVKYTRGLVLIPIGALWLFDFSFIINTQALFYYSIGATFAVFNKSRNVTRQSNWLMAIVSIIVWVSLSGCLTVLAAYTSKDSGSISLLMTIIYKVNEIAGIVSVWLLFDHLFSFVTNKRPLIFLTGHLFFIYVLHEPLLHFTYQLSSVSGITDFGRLILYVGLPISNIAICVMLSMIIRKIARPLHRLLTGDRSGNVTLHPIRADRLRK